MTRAKKIKRVVLPVLASETVQCTRLRCTLAIGSCVSRWQRAQANALVRGSAHAGNEREGVAFVSWRSCPEGRERAGIVGNDNGRGGRC